MVSLWEHLQHLGPRVTKTQVEIRNPLETRTDKNLINNNIRDHTLRHRVVATVPTLGTTITHNTIGEIITLNLYRATNLFLNMDSHQQPSVPLVGIGSSRGMGCYSC